MSSTDQRDQLLENKNWLVLMRLYCPIFISQWFCKAVILLTFLQKLPQLCLDVY